MGKCTTISQYLIESLQKAGIEHIFGIPGDYIINFFSEMEKSPLNIVGTCSEQGAAFAADAYARMHGLGALAVTYCVGGLNTINAVAGAYAEKAPLIVISGAPGMNEHDSDYLLHHSIRDLDSQWNMFKEVTVASTRLDDPYTAAFEIDRVIDACIRHKRPVYIEFPRDMLHEECMVSPEKPGLKCKINPNNLKEALNEAAELIKKAKKPVIIGGVEIRRYHLEKEFLDLLESTGFPYCTSLLGKSVINESHPQYLGIYMGKLGEEKVRQYIEEADCTIILGDLMTDMNMATAQLDISKTIYAASDQLCIKHHYYKDIDFKEFVVGLTNSIKNEHKHEIFNTEEEDKFELQPDSPITSNRFFKELNKFLKEGTLVICDVGDCLFGSSQMRLPKNSCYLGPAFYTSMGYAVPAALGAMIKNPETRPIVIVGDGAFQMTGHEVSCFVKHDLKPIIFIINNNGYTTQRFIKDGSYNEINQWKYHKITELVNGGLGLEVKTEGELEEALILAENNKDSFTIVNVHLDKYEKSDVLFRLTQAFSKKA